MNFEKYIAPFLHTKIVLYSAYSSNLKFYEKRLQKRSSEKAVHGP